MAKKKADVGRKAWNILRLALLWARKGCVFRRRLMMELRLLPKYLKSLGHHSTHDQLHYGEHEFSFDETPIIRVKMHCPASMRFLLPCICPQDVDFDCHFNYKDDVLYDGGRISFLKGSDDDGGQGEGECSGVFDGSEEVEDGIDLRAERFISKFYEQIKLQRQISCLEYNEMLNRGDN